MTKPTPSRAKGDLLTRRLKTAARSVLDRHSGAIGSVLSVNTQEPVVILTYDDGPHEDDTDRVLQALADHEATATFFVLLTRARRHRNLLSALNAAGHEVALHGVDHRRLTHLSGSQVRRLMTDGRAELQDLAQTHVRWFRPPYGAQTLSTWRSIRAAGMTSVGWGATSWDWKDVSNPQRIDKAMTATRGTILLSHDGFADSTDGAQDGPVPLLDKRELNDQILTGFADRGLAGVSLGQALISGSAHRAAWFRR